MDQIRLALGGDWDSLTARLLSQLSVEGRDSEPSNIAERPSASENSFMDSLAIPKAQAGANILRYEVAMKRQIAVDCKELGRLQEIRQSLGLNPGPTGAKYPSLN